MQEYAYQVLFHILSTEQDLLKRTDQKASTLLSTLAIFMVFFIVHYRDIPTILPVLILIYIYFGSAFITIMCLLRVMVPRIKNAAVKTGSDTDAPNPTFFAGIAQFDSPDKYREHLFKILDDPKTSCHVLSNNIFAVGHINAQKQKFYALGMKAFIFAIFVELIIIVSMYVKYLIPMNKIM